MSIGCVQLEELSSSVAEQLCLSELIVDLPPSAMASVQRQLLELLSEQDGCLIEGLVLSCSITKIFKEKYEVLFCRTCIYLCLCAFSIKYAHAHVHIHVNVSYFLCACMCVYGMCVCVCVCVCVWVGMWVDRQLYIHDIIHCIMHDFSHLLRVCMCAHMYMYILEFYWYVYVPQS